MSSSESGADVARRLLRHAEDALVRYGDAAAISVNVVEIMKACRLALEKEDTGSEETTIKLMKAISEQRDVYANENQHLRVSVHEIIAEIDRIIANFDRLDVERLKTLRTMAENAIRTNLAR